MAARTANGKVVHLPSMELRQFPVGAGEHIYLSSIVGVDPAGYLKTFVPCDVAVGIAYEECNNAAGAAGAKYCQVYVDGDFEWPWASAALTDIGKPLYATDDQTLALTGHPDAYVGCVVHKDADAAGYTILRLKQPGEAPPNDGSCVDLRLDFSKFNVVNQDESVATLKLVGTGWKTAAVGAGLTAGTSGLLIDEATGELVALIDNADEAENLTLESEQVFNITKGATFTMIGRNSVAGGVATDDVDFGLMGLAGGITATERADMNAASAGLLSCLFHINANALDIFGSSDDNASPITATDTTINNSLTVNKEHTVLCRPTGVCELWIARARMLSTTVFSVGAAGLLAAIANIEKSTGTGVPEMRIRNLRAAGAIA